MAESARLVRLPSLTEKIRGAAMPGQDKPYRRSLVLGNTYVSGLAISGRGAGLSLPLEGSMTGAVSASRKPMLLKLDRIDNLLEAYPYLAPVVDAGVRTSVVVPLIYSGGSIGVLLLDSMHADAYDLHHLQLAERVADQIAGAIANAQLYAERQRSEQEI